jgi:hypothetical protein
MCGQGAAIFGLPTKSDFERIGDAVKLAVATGLPRSIPGAFMPRKLVSLGTAAAAVLLLPSLHAQLNNSARIALMQDDAGVVTGEPCVVAEKTEIVHPLADGTTLTRRTEIRKWRDSQGRFRKEGTEVENGQPPVFHTASIIDPGNRTLTLLNMDEKKAIIFHLPDQGPWSLHPYVELDDKVPEALPGVQVKVEKLDGKTIAGVYATGRRVTRIRPPGTIGNDKPVVSVAERWVSPDIKILLESASVDPRETETREVTRLDRGEPDPKVFSVPSDYTVKEVTVPPPQTRQ